MTPDTKKTGQRIPISDAKTIGNKLGYTQVIITAFDKTTGTTSVCTWGKSQEDCIQAAQGGNFVKKALGWPPEKCNDKPSRQIRNEKLLSLLKKFIEIVDNPHDNDGVNLARFVAATELSKRELNPEKQTP